MFALVTGVQTCALPICAIGARAFKQALEQQSGGAMQVQLYPNRQLGDDKQLVEGVRFGTVDAAVVTNAVTAQTEPAFGVLDLPFLFENAARSEERRVGKE